MTFLLQILLLFCLCSICVANETQIVTSKLVALEATVPGIHSQNRIAVVTADIDGNSHPDLVVFYGTAISRSTSIGESTSNFNHMVTFSYRVFYDFYRGPREWFGLDGFAPLRISGFSEPFDGFVSQSLSEYRYRAATCGAYSYGSWYENRDYPYGLALTSADLDGNGKPEIIALSAIRFWGCHSCGTGANQCGSPQNTNRLRVQMRILWNFNVDGSHQSLSSIDEHTFNLPQERGYSSNSYIDATPSIRVEANGCSSNNHLLVLVMGKLRTEFCFSGSPGSGVSIGALRTGGSQTFSVNNPTVSMYSTSVPLSINNYFYHMFIDRNSKTFSLVPENFGSLIVSNVELPSSFGSLGVISNDFDGDGIDDFLFVDCDADKEACGIRHGSLFSVSTSDYNVIVHNFEEELLYF
ncbi:hypothetical protein RCL1_000506 [Eukaryota sp. TZLM3-RCL]